MTIYFDMDGTIADLYGVPNWLPKIIAEDVSPYIDAQPLIDMEELQDKIKQLQFLGVKFGIVSYMSKCGTPTFDAAGRKAKRAWLKKHLPNVKFDEIHCVKYGRNKAKVAKFSKGGILFDDEQARREEWRKNGGTAYNPQKENILAVLEEISTYF